MITLKRNIYILVAITMYVSMRVNICFTVVIALVVVFSSFMVNLGTSEFSCYSAEIVRRRFCWELYENTDNFTVDMSFLRYLGREDVMGAVFWGDLLVLPAYSHFYAYLTQLYFIEIDECGLADILGSYLVYGVFIGLDFNERYLVSAYNSFVHPDEGSFILCLRKDGGDIDEKWLLNIDEHGIAEPVIFGNHVIYVTPSCLYCIDLESGEIVWRRNVEEEYLTTDPTIVEGEHALVLVGNSMGSVYCISLSDGSVVGKIRVSSEYVYDLDFMNGTLFVVDSSYTVYAIDFDTGKLVWGNTVEDPMRDPGYSFSLYASRYGLIVSGERIPHDGVVICLDLFSGVEKWRLETGVHVKGFRFDLGDGYVLLGLYLVDLMLGKIVMGDIVCIHGRILILFWGFPSFDRARFGVFIEKRDFDAVPAIGDIRVSAGEEVDVPVRVIRYGGLSDPIKVEVENVSWAKVVVPVNPLTVEENVTLRIRLSENIAPGTYNITVTFRCGELVKKVYITLNVIHGVPSLEISIRVLSTYFAAILIAYAIYQMKRVKLH